MTQTTAVDLVRAPSMVCALCSPHEGSRAGHSRLRARKPIDVDQGKLNFRAAPRDPPLRTARQSHAESSKASGRHFKQPVQPARIDRHHRRFAALRLACMARRTALSAPCHCIAPAQPKKGYWLLPPPSIAQHQCQMKVPWWRSP